jgi:hypothetical protein
MNASAFLRNKGARALTALVAAIGLWLAAPAAQAMTIERVVSPGGIEAWLVRDSALPLIAMEFAVLGGADQDPLGKPGVANMATSLLDEGAGPFDAAAFQGRLESKAIELSFRSGRDYLRGTLRTLKENRDEAFDFLRLALTEPRKRPQPGRQSSRSASAHHGAERPSHWPMGVRRRIFLREPRASPPRLSR